MRKYLHGKLIKRQLLLLASIFTTTVAATAGDLVATAERSPEISFFADAVKAAGISGALRTGGPFTVFAPSDSAFSRLAPETKKSLLSDRETARKMVLNHIVPEKMLIVEIKPGATETLGGDTINLTSDNGLVKVDGATVIQSDVVADNGVIHVIENPVRLDE